MKKIFLLALSIIYVASASQTGEQIFKRCGICHGDKGQKHSLNLTKYIAGMDKGALTTILKEYRAKTRNSYGLGTMMQGQASKLSDEDIDAVTTFISALPPVKLENRTKAKPSKMLKDGADIFKRCAICHGSQGNKRSLNVSKYIAGMDKNKIYKTLKAYRSGTLSTYGYGRMMKGQATKLNDLQMKEVAEYISMLPPVEEKSTKTPKKRITKKEVDRNTFIRNFFANSKNPNETLKAAEAAYKEYIKTQKENNE